MPAQGFAGVIFTQIADGAADASASETALGTSSTIAGSGTGSVADGSLSSFWYPGKTLRITAAGRITTASSSQGNVTFTLRLDTTSGTSIAASAAIALAASQTNITWFLEGMLVCRSIGTAGSIIFIGSVVIGAAATTNVANQMPATAPATAAIDTTANHQILLDATLGSSSDSCTLHQYIIEALN